MTPAERMATARRALERAEAAAGLRTRLAVAADDAASPRPVASHLAAAPAPDTAPEGPGAPAPVPPRAGVPTDADHLPVPAPLAGFFPPAGLRRGSVVQVGGSSSLLLTLLAAAQGEGWVALAALPDIGLQAAADAGLHLGRSLLVPRPGPEAASVVGALVDGVDVLAVGDCRALSARDRRLLSARLRTRGAVLLSTAHWPGADVVLRAGEARTGGLGRGWGRVEAGEMTVHGRGRSGVAGRVRVRLTSTGLDVVADGAREATGPVPAAAAPAVAADAGAAASRLRAVS
ncbi:hypothetical protein SAMN05216184_11066 [Georgenia satyanarayanai]|uniref:Protein RecA n=2 Tax=Georgenia satyanarayanai TaxID=860221 RepID=A0A2Y9AKS2_9MICO|nr:hypothetical protein A8987_11066 [Georgenia satyanarayanai]SSA44775.1 hypothetical protein SAMN05216184_11066 [Georgenia satyanarayanai]